MAKNKTKSLFQKLNDGADPYAWGLNVEYDRRPAGGRCQCDDYCRCSIISNIRVTSFDYRYLFTDLASKRKLKIESLQDYLLERFLSRIKNEDFEVFAVSGYYGQELGGAIYKQSHDLNSLIDRLNSDNGNMTELVEECLIREYGYLLPTLENKNWKFQEIQFAEIVSTPMDHGYSKLHREKIEEYKKYPDALAVVCLEVGENKYRLIDGNHRYSAVKELKLKTINAVIAC